MLKKIAPAIKPIDKIPPIGADLLKRSKAPVISSIKPMPILPKVSIPSVSKI